MLAATALVTTTAINTAAPTPGCTVARTVAVVVPPPLLHKPATWTACCCRWPGVGNPVGAQLLPPRVHRYEACVMHRRLALIVAQGGPGPMIVVACRHRHAATAVLAVTAAVEGRVVRRRVTLAGGRCMESTQPCVTMHICLFDDSIPLLATHHTNHTTMLMYATRHTAPAVMPIALPLVWASRHLRGHYHVAVASAQLRQV